MRKSLVGVPRATAFAKNWANRCGFIHRCNEAGSNPSEKASRPVATQNMDDAPFRHYTTKHQIASWVSQTFFDRVTYTVQRGLLKGMKRKGGIVWLPEFLGGLSATPEQAFWSKVNLRDLVIYDIGAFQGLLTLFFASKGRHVVCYEPNARNHARLIENLRLNLVKNVLVRKIGIGSKQGVATMVALPSMLGGASTEHYAVEGLLNSKRSLLTEQISITTLDQDIIEFSLSKPDFIKVDIEGGELAALVGARNTLRAHHPRLLLEMHGETVNLKRKNVAAIVVYLHELGYAEIRHIESETLINVENSSVACEGHLYCLPSGSS